MFKSRQGLLHLTKLAINEEMAHTIGAIFRPVRCQIALIVDGYDEMDVVDMILMELLAMNIHHHRPLVIIMTPTTAERDEDGPSAIPQIGKKPFIILLA